MDPESKKLLEDTFELAKENNKMLHKVRGVQKRQVLWSTIKFILIIGVAFGVFYFLEPYLNKVMNTFNQISGMKQNFDNGSLQDILKKL